MPRVVDDTYYLDNSVDRSLILLSIAHWERMRSQGCACGELPNAPDCPLCQKYLSSSFDGCEGCPVRSFTGTRECKKTPYFLAFWAYKECGLDSTEFQVAAALEIEFLNDVLWAFNEGVI